jgi:hypothetical protein
MRRKKAEGRRSAISIDDRAKEQEMVRTTIWLPQHVHQRLKEISGSGGVSEEIRRRLEASDKVSRDPKTAELVEAITFVADKLAMHFGNWSKDRFSYEALRAAIDLWLTARCPEGEPIMKPNPNRDPFDSSFGPDTSPENAARFLLAILTWLNREEEGKRR